MGDDALGRRSDSKAVGWGRETLESPQCIPNHPKFDHFIAYFSLKRRSFGLNLGIRRDARDFSLLYFGTFLARNQVCVFGSFEWCPLKPQETCCKCCQSRQSRYMIQKGRYGLFLAILWRVLGTKSSVVCGPQWVLG